MRKLEEPIVLASANGDVTAEWTTKIHVPQLNITVEALVLDDTQECLSVGKIVKDYRMSYRWDPGQKRVFVKKGKIFEMYPIHDVPFVCSSSQGEQQSSDQPEEAEGTTHAAEDPQHTPQHHSPPQPPAPPSSP